jgi:hypothetical protein
MANQLKLNILNRMEKRYGRVHKLAHSQSLFDVGDGALRVYFRYSAVHDGTKTFYGLREEDLRQLEGHPSVVCFLWDNQEEPLYLPYADYEEVFRTVEPAHDGQYKVQIYFTAQGTELYLPRTGRFNIDGYFGWDVVEQLVDSSKIQQVPALSHSQMQTLLGAIGSLKHFDVWIPLIDRNKLDLSIASPVTCCDQLPLGFESVKGILPEIDVIWIERGAGGLRALFEVEHSTPIYSGLLRFNDIHLVAPTLQPTFAIVANDERRETFIQQLLRPTFKASGLSQFCTFMKYENVFSWYQRTRKSR